MCACVIPSICFLNDDCCVGALSVNLQLSVGSPRNEAADHSLDKNRSLRKESNDEGQSGGKRAQCLTLVSCSSMYSVTFAAGILLSWSIRVSLERSLWIFKRSSLTRTCAALITIIVW